MGSPDVLDYRTFRLAAVHELISSGHEWKIVLWGDLGGMPATELLNILSLGNRTGLLLVRGEDASERALGFHGGNTTWCASSEMPEQVAHEVAFGLVRMQRGIFTFLRGPVPPGEGPTVQELLLDGLRRLDEARELSR
jgi:hypothetical protein